jgi:antibiotic biosynthesis monooxygenase (ABM) superfamily enzyme
MIVLCQRAGTHRNETCFMVGFMNSHERTYLLIEGTNGWIEEIPVRERNGTIDKKESKVTKPKVRSRYPMACVVTGLMYGL